MHHHVYHDTNMFLQFGFPEVVYRSRGPPLSMLLNSSLLGRSSNFMTEIQKDYPRHEVINSMAEIRLDVDTRGFVGSCGFNHTELEIVALGAQPTWSQQPEIFDTPSSFTDIFQDILSTEYPSASPSPCQEAHLHRRSQEAVDFNTCHYTTERCNGEEAIDRRALRFKRLSYIAPGSLGTHRIAQLRVDDKMPDRPLVYARNANGCFISRFHVKPWDNDASSINNDSPNAFSHDHQDVSTYFPSVVPDVIADMPFDLDNNITSMFVSPHEYGVWAATTKKKQLIVWDTTISAPSAKVDLFKSTEKHLSNGEMYNKWYGCVAGDSLECGTFTDRHDVILLGGSKLYVADFRSRSLGYIFPTMNVRPPSTYRFPRLNTRLPMSDRFLAIERHPTSQCLYAIVSGVSSSILLWDIRNPSEIICELPLPLLRQGRSGFRHLQWQNGSLPLEYKNRENLWLLSAFSWNHSCVSVNTVAVHDSATSIAHNETRKDIMMKYLEVARRKQDVTPASEDAMSTESTEFWDLHTKALKKDRSPFFVNPFLLYPSPSRSILPVCDPSGLCFLSSRPPLQIVVYHQAQIPLGIPTKESEMRYFHPRGPILTCSETLLNEGLHSSLNEAPLSQIFHGLAGICVATIDIFRSPRRQLKPTLILLGLTFSGRVTCCQLNLVRHRRKEMFAKTTEKKKKTKKNLYDLLLGSANFPISNRAKQAGVLPHYPPIDNLLRKVQHNVSQGEHQKSSTLRKTSLIGWNPLPRDVYGSQQQPHNFLLFTSFFSSQLDQDIQHHQLRGLHELLRPNNDSLDYHTFIISPKMNFSRQRIETALYWRRPMINAVFFAEALLDMLVNPTSLSISKCNNDLPLILPTISKTTTTTTTTTTIEPLHPPAVSWYSVNEVLGYLTSASMTESYPLTLHEVFLRCDDTISRTVLLEALHSTIQQHNFVLWLTTTARVDHTPVEFLPIPRPEHFRWKGVAERIASPLCSCEAVIAMKPLCLKYDDTRPLWVAWTPHLEHLMYTSYVRYMSRQVQCASQHITEDHKTFPRTPQKFQKKTLARLAEVFLGQYIPVFPIVDAQGESGVMVETTIPRCSLEKKPNPFCLLPHVLVIQNSSNTSTGRYNRESVVQGRRFISANEEDLLRASAREQHFILKNSPRDYPAYYAFLTGVRVTERLYLNLEKEWPLLPSSISSSCDFLRPSLTNPLACSISSSTNLLKFASTAAIEAARQEKAKNYQAAVGALTSQMKKRIGPRSLSVGFTDSAGGSYFDSSQSLSKTLQQLSQDLDTPFHSQLTQSQDITKEDGASQQVLKPGSILPAILRYGMEMGDT